MNENKTIGDLMNDQKRAAMKGASVFMAVVLYAAVIVYTGVHNFNLASRTVAEDQQLFAILALMCLEGGAIFLPLAIHFWLAPGSQRMVGYVLYGLNFAIVIMNTVLDAITNKAETIPAWLTIYGTFIFPATPVIIGIGVAFMFLLDPSKKIHDAAESAKAAAIDATALRMRESAQDADVNAMVTNAAMRNLMDIVGGTLNQRGTRALPAAQTEPAPEPDEQPAPARQARPAKAEVVDAPPARQPAVQMAAQPEVKARAAQPTAASVMSDFIDLTPAERAKIMAYLQNDKADTGADVTEDADGAGEGGENPL
jgi:hypothetical protein